MSVADRLTELEARISALESGQRQADSVPDSAPVTASDPVRSSEQDSNAGTFWVLDELRRRIAELPRGAVVFAGSVRTEAGPAEWQYGQATDDLIDSDADTRTGTAERLAALGHPVRIQLLQAVLDGHASPTTLAALEGIGTTGQVYHHIRILTTAGWLRSARRNHLEIPPERIVPLLVALAVAR